MALFVALNALSGYVTAAPLKNMETDSFIKAAFNIIKQFEKLGICIQKFLSDNARQFHSIQFVNFCTGAGLKKVFTTPYNPPGNPVERVMRDLGDKFRLLYCNEDQEIRDHRNWDEYLNKIIFVLNNTPKTSGYTPSKILGLEPHAPFRKVKILPRVRTLGSKIKKELAASTVNTKSFTPTIAMKLCKLDTFTYDSEGFVNIWTDAATKGKGDEDRASAVGHWLGPGHIGNKAYILDPPIKNNKAETMAIILAILYLIRNRVGKIRIKTDSQYLADLYNGGYLHQTHQNLQKQENLDILMFFIDLLAQTKLHNPANFKLKIEHIPGHAVDFGNLEADWLVGWVLDRYVTYHDLLHPLIPELTRLQRYIYESKRLDQAKQDHYNTLKTTGTTSFDIGDVVAIKNHPLSSAPYRLKSKFMPRYMDEYVVVGRLSPNTYFVRDINDANAPHPSESRTGDKNYCSATRSDVWVTNAGKDSSEKNRAARETGVRCRTINHICGCFYFIFYAANKVKRTNFKFQNFAN